MQLIYIWISTGTTYFVVLGATTRTPARQAVEEMGCMHGRWLAPPRGPGALRGVKNTSFGQKTGVRPPPPKKCGGGGGGAPQKQGPRKKVKKQPVVNLKS
jgi:hypothetical protein